jgi:quercetin dioxygenase-like cupin family protein
MSESSAASGGFTVRRLAEAGAYQAPNHFDVRSMRLIGLEAGGSTGFWVGLSHLLPGGGAGPDSSPVEKVYVVTAGEITVEVDGKLHVLKPMDSCCIGPGVVRTVTNKTNAVASMLVIMPPPPKAA